MEDAIPRTFSPAGCPQFQLGANNLSFEIARLLFQDPHAISIQDRHDNARARWQTMGRAGEHMILLVAQAVRDNSVGEEIVDMISAREATARERRSYEQIDR